MISFFPEMYPDELLYSVFERYHKFSGNLEMKDSMFDLLGNSSTLCLVELPRRLRNLVARTERYGVSYEDVLINRTFFPFYAFFEGDHKINELRAWSLDYSKFGSFYSKETWNSSYSFNKHFCVCPECFEEEKATLGEAYWHRIHQIPGVLVCNKHKKMLCNCDYDINRFSSSSCPEHEELFPLSPFKKLSEIELDTAAKLTEGIQWLFDNFTTTHELWSNCSMGYREVYLHLLAKKGFVTKNGTVLLSQWKRDFCRYYGKIYSFLENDRSRDFYNKSQWQRDYFRYYGRNYLRESKFFWESGIFIEPPRKIYPVQHFLMMHYLSGSIRGFFDQLQNFELVQPICFFSSRAKPYNFDRRARVCRNVWMNNFELYHLEKQAHWRAQREYSWLFFYDHEWLVENAGTTLNLQKIKEKDEKYNRYKGAAALQFNTSQTPIRISKKLLKRFKKPIKCLIPKVNSVHLVMKFSSSVSKRKIVEVLSIVA